MRDPIVEEVRGWGAKIAEESDYDLRRILLHARETAARIPNLRYVTKDQLQSDRAHAAPADNMPASKR
jgi:hypothetical protein